MGNWNMTISGIGQHHNMHHAVAGVQLKDADHLFKEFIQHLQRNGHLITNANFTYGGAEEIDLKNMNIGG